MKKLLSTCSICLFAVFNLLAQDLHVYCDAFTDSVFFMRNNRVVEKPAVRKGDQVVIHVKNYNSYLYNINLETEKSSVTISQGVFGKGLDAVSGGNPFEVLLKSVGGSLPVLPLLDGGIFDNTHGFASAEDEETSKQIKKYEIELNRNLSGMQQTNAELLTLEAKIKKELSVQKLKAFSSLEIDRLRYDPNIEPAQIKRMTKEYAQQLFQESDPEKLTLEYVITQTDAQDAIEALIADYHKKVTRYERFQQKTVTLGKDLKKFSFPNTNLEVFMDSIQLATETATEKLESFQDNLKKLDATQDGPNTFDPSKMAALRSSYISFMANDFSKTYRQVAAGNDLSFRIKLEPVDSALYVGARSKQLPPIPVKIYGGVKVNTGVGVGFASFFQKPKDYFVRDSTVFSSDKDAFSPVLSTFIHFFSPRSGNLSWGGSFGVGIPLGGENNLQSISFFLGPSAVIGQEHNIVISGGLSGGKVPIPAQGYQVGDRFTSDASFFKTESKYALGYFLGVSFSVGGK